jgi:hypothetical protein
MVQDPMEKKIILATKNQASYHTILDSDNKNAKESKLR